MKKIELICDANPLERIEITYDKYGMHIAVVDENYEYHEIQLKGSSIGYLIDFIDEVKQEKEHGTWLKDSNVNGGKR